MENANTLSSFNNMKKFYLTLSEYDLIRFCLDYRHINELLVDSSEAGGGKLMIGAYFIVNTKLLKFDEENRIFAFDFTQDTGENVWEHYMTAEFLNQTISKYYLKDNVNIFASNYHGCIKKTTGYADFPHLGDGIFGLPGDFWSNCGVVFIDDVTIFTRAISHFASKLGFQVKDIDSVQSDVLESAVDILLFYEIDPLPIIGIIPISVSALNLGLYELYEDGKFTDFTFELANNEFKVHQNVFYANGGDYFKKFYSGKFKSTESKIYIDFSNETTVSDYIDYVYLGPTAFEKKYEINILSLLQLATFFGQSNLEAYCLNSISLTATPENYDDLLDVYKLNPSPEFKNVLDVLKTYYSTDK